MYDSLTGPGRKKAGGRSGVVDLFEGCTGKKLTGRLSWLREPECWEFEKGSLLIVPGAKTDFFRPHGAPARDNACLLFTRVNGDFTAVAGVEAVLAGFGDAAAVTIRSDERHWAKLCVERSPAAEVSIVSVVTNETSDDSNNELLDQPMSLLRLTRKGDVFGMHYSTDGKKWRFVRTFGLPLPADVMVGIHAQAPFQAGCRTVFHSFTIDEKAVQDFRSGE